jgi:hypothetical protein
MPTCQLWVSAARVQPRVFVVHVSVWEESEYQQWVTLRTSDHQPSQCFDENRLFGSEEWVKHESKSGGEKSRRTRTGERSDRQHESSRDVHQQNPSQAIVVRLQHELHRCRISSDKL